MVKTVVKQALIHKMGNAAREKVLEPQREIASKVKWSSTLSKTPKPSAIPNFAKPRYEIEAEKGFAAVVVKTVVKQALTRKMGNTAREKVLEPQGKIVSRANQSSTLSKTPKAGALPATLHPDSVGIIQDSCEKSNSYLFGFAFETEKWYNETPKGDWVWRSEAFCARNG